MCNEPTMLQKKRQAFTPEQDQQVINYVNSCMGSKPDWKVIAPLVGKSARQCRERFRMYLSPVLDSNRQWTPEEDQRLMQLVKTYGKHWAKFKSYFPGRSDNNIKNRYNYHLVPIRGPKKRQNKIIEAIRDDSLPEVASILDTQQVETFDFLFAEDEAPLEYMVLDQ